MMPDRYVIGNWKMNGSRAMLASLLPEVKVAAESAAGVECVVCPPAPYLHEAWKLLGNSALKLGGQDCHTGASGSHTGEVSALMLADSGCRYVILGHSERRTQFGEDDALVHAKAQAAITAGLIPVICVGESLAVREAGGAEAFVADQLKASLPFTGSSPIIIAYEPVWAIGTGKVAETTDIARMHEHLLGLLTAPGKGDHLAVYILYGGSVKADNAAEILDLPSVGGVLVGGASLEPKQFCGIIAAASTREKRS